MAIITTLLLLGDIVGLISAPKTITVGALVLGGLMAMVAAVIPFAPKPLRVGLATMLVVYAMAFFI